MNLKNSTLRYGSLSIGIHWLMVLLFIALYGTINLHELFEKGSYLREALKTWHFMLGLLVFALFGCASQRDCRAPRRPSCRSYRSCNNNPRGCCIWRCIC